METKYLEIDSKIKIANFFEYSQNSNFGVVIIHGLAEHKGRYKEFIRQLLNNNISVFAMDIRGHGESTGRRGDVKYFKNYLSDLHAFISQIKEKHPELKLAIFGHSLGGLIASAYACEYNTIDMLILSSPVLKVPAGLKILKFIPYRWLGWMKIKKIHSESRKMLERSRNDPLSCHYFSLRLVGNMFIDGVEYVMKRIKNINASVLMLGGGLDPLVNSGFFEEVLEEFGSEDKTVRIYENKRHRMVQNENRDEIIAEIVEWIKRPNKVEMKN